jgi:hypothetical protein
VRKHRWKLIGAVTLALVAAGTFAAWPRPSSRITVENCERVKFVKTLAEVEAVLGPPRDERTGPTYRAASAWDWYGSHGDNYGAIPVPRFFWKSDTVRFSVTVEADGTLLSKSFVEFERRPQGLLDNLRWRAEHLWRKWSPSDDDPHVVFK